MRESSVAGHFAMRRGVHSTRSIRNLPDAGCRDSARVAAFAFTGDA
jgi:hypothetical protein